jgi:hypothetical protein
MMKIDRFSGLPNMGVAIVLMMAGMAVAQTPTPDAAPVVQDGFVIHNTVDLGGHIVGVTGSGAMYDTLVNIHSGPRILGQTFTIHALPATKHILFDDLSAFSAGFGGDPNNFAKMDISKGKLYEFSGLFRRDRQYFDYNLLGNTNTPVLTAPYGLVNGNATAASAPWPQERDSEVLYNTVRRMLDTNLTILPLSKVTFRVAYSHGIFQGPTLSPARSVGKYDANLEEFQRNSTDDYTAAVDWKPVAHTKLTYEEQIDRYKADYFFTLAPSDFVAQEADGTPVALGNYDALASPYTSAACNTGSMGAAYTNSTNYTIFTAPPTAGGLPIINPACDVITSYMRSQPTRILYPTEILRLQSTSIKNIALNGDFRFMNANSTLPSYYEYWTGLDGVNATATGVTPAYPAQAIRSALFTGNASTQRQMIAADYGMTWQATSTISLADQVDYSNVHQPGISNISAGITTNTATNPNETIFYTGTLGPGATYSITGNPNGTPLTGYFGQRFLTNNATVSWDATPRATLALTYRYRQHEIVQGAATGTNALVIDIAENAGILNATVRPTNHWDINGTAEISYSDNAFTPMSPRQLQHYRVHTLYRPKTWATISGAFNDLERHNNTNNTGTPSIDGPLQHEDHTRIVSLGATLAPNEHYGFDFNYSYSDVYITTNACYLSGASATLPGAAQLTSSGTNNICPNLTTEWGPVKDFMDAPTQYASMALTLSPSKAFHSDIGYRISAVSGNQFFNDAQEVNGSLQSAYQSPFVNLAWTVKPGWVWRAEYNYYGYGEGGPSGAALCSTSTSAAAAVASCNSSTFAGLPTGRTEPSSGLTAPRNFHANNVTLAMHYEF